MLKTILEIKYKVLPNINKVLTIYSCGNESYTKYIVKIKNVDMEEKKIMRKKFLGAIAVGLAFSMIACGGSKDSAKHSMEEKTSSTGVKEDERTKLRFSWWGGDTRHKATLDMIQQYEEGNPNVEIAGEYGGWDGYLEKMTTQLAAGTAPDIIQIDYAFLENLWKTNDFVDFRKEDLIDLSEFPEAILEGITSPNGALIGIPSGVNFTCLFGSKTTAEKYGIDLSQHFTWDVLLEEGKKVHEQDQEAYLIYPNTINRFIFEPYLFNLTGKKLVGDDYVIGFSEKEVEKTLEYITELYDENVIQPYDQTVEIQTPVENPLWLNNQIVMCPDFSSGYDQFKASLPEGDLVCVEPLGDSDAQNSGIVLRPTNMIAVNANSEHLEEALKFANYFFNNEKAIKTLEMSRSIPSNKKALDIMLTEGKLDPDLKKINEFAEEHKGGLGQNVISTNAEIETIENDVLNAVYYKEKSPAEGAEEFVKLMEEKVLELKEISEQ